MLKELIFLITNEKGGVGKTTLTLISAWSLGRASKYKILVIDADVSQANAFQWSLKYNDKEMDNVESGKIYKAKLGHYDVVWIVSPNEIGYDLISTYDIILVDGRPSDIVNNVFVPYAHRIIVPFMKRKKDLSSTRYWIGELKQQGYGDKVKLFYNKYCDEIAKGLPVPKWFLDYVSSMATGLIRIGGIIYDMTPAEKYTGKVVI